jgi:hydrogenase-1 operon protein HyaF
VHIDPPPSPDAAPVAAGGRVPPPVPAPPAALRLLARLEAAVDACLAGRPVRAIGLAGLAPASLAVIDDVLGRGEVSIRADAQRLLAIDESAMAGVWRVRAFADVDAGPAADRIEVGVIPPSLRRALVGGSRRLPIAAAAEEGAGNALPLLHELRHHLRRRRQGAAAVVVNLSNLPLAPAERAVLDRALGRGRVSGLSRGAVRCRVLATAVRAVWRVQYLGQDDGPIAENVEIVDVPDALAAQAVDIAAGRPRLAEMIRLYR